MARRLFPRAARVDSALALSATAIGTSGLVFGLVAVALLAARSLGSFQASALLAGLMLATALVLVLILRLRRRAGASRQPPPGAPVSAGDQPAVFATFLVGFLLARRFLGPR